MTRRDRTILGVFVLVLLGWSVAQFVMDQSRGSRDPRLPSSTSRSAGPDGTRALRYLLEQRGVSVREWRRSWLQLRETDFVLVSLGSTRWAWNAEPLVPMEIDALRAWIESGGTAFLTGETAFEFVGGQAYSPGRPTGVLPSVGRVTLSEVEFSFRNLPDGTDVLVSMNERAVVARLPVGEGEVYVIADSTLLQNARIGEDDNAALAALIMASGRPVAFDEFRHGFAASRSPLEAFAPSARVGIVFLLVIAGLAVLKHGQRPAGIRSEAELTPHRSGAEIAWALGVLLQKGKGAVPALESRAEIFRQAFGLAPQDALVRALPPQCPARLREALAAVDAALELYNVEIADLERHLRTLTDASAWLRDIRRGRASKTRAVR